ncbi:MAG TPA: hypothetical protein VJZ71_14050 [Phycisphaerae bacterium]|nr:hypothetical protein [Phycisphaerae bacterium]
MSRKGQRVLVSLFALGAGAVFVLFFKNWTYGDLPVPWIGYLIMAIGALGLIGVNVFIWGPLDKRNDEN